MAFFLSSNGSINSLVAAGSDGGAISAFTYHYVEAFNSIQVNSSAYVLIPNMSLTITKAGDYLVLFNAWMNHKRDTEIIFRVNGIDLPDTYTKSKVKKSCFVLNKVITFQANDLLEVYWRSTRTMKIKYRTLFALKLA